MKTIEMMTKTKEKRKMCFSNIVPQLDPIFIRKINIPKNHGGSL